MFKIGSFIISICFVFGQLNAQQDWLKFSPPGQNFEIASPTEMTNGEKKILTDVGPMRPVTWLSQGGKDDPNYLYMVSFVDYPPLTFSSDSTELISEFFKTSIAAQVENLEGNLVYSSESTFGQHPSVIYRITYNKNGAVVKGRMILVHDRFYAIQVYTLSEKSLNPMMDRFLNSFRLK